MQAHIHRRARNIRPGHKKNAATPGVEREVAHSEARPELEGAYEDHCDCERDVDSDKNANRPKGFVTIRRVAKEIVQRIAAHVVDDRADEQCPRDGLCG